MKNYIINEDTYAIIAIGSNKSIIYEKNNRFIVNSRPNRIIKRNCYYNGSTFEGRMNATKYLTGYTYKTPILIREEGNIIFFPTKSSRLEDCSWISLNNIYNYCKTTNKYISRIIFQNKIYIELPLTYNILNNQILRSMNLESKLRKKCL